MHTINLADTKTLFNKRVQWATLIDTLIKHEKYYHCIIQYVSMNLKIVKGKP
jgi:hypothetical protein